MTRFARTTLFCALALASQLATAGGPYEIQPPVLAADGAANNILGFSVAASKTPGTLANPSFAIAGAVGIAAYIYTAPLPAATASNFSAPVRLASGVANDSFGLAVAIMGSGNSALAIVGAPADDAGTANPSANFGLVYLYGRVSGSWSLLGTITPPTQSLAGNFGTAVATNGSDTLFIGEPRALVNGVERGAVHVYRLVGGLLQFQTSISRSGVTAPRFGQSVAVSGSTLAIGAPLDDHDLTATITADAGAISVYTGGGASWTEQARLFADDFAAGDRLGLSVSIDGETLLGGAGNDDKLAGIEAGSAYIFTRSVNSWSQQAKLRSTQAQVQERFGNSVSLEGNEAVVGAYCLAAGGCVGPGAVYTYQRIGSTWSLRQRFSPVPGFNGDSFGHAVAHGARNYVIAGAFGVDGSGGADQVAVYALTTVDRIFSNGFEDPAPVINP